MYVVGRKRREGVMNGVERKGERGGSLEEGTIYVEAKIENFSCGKLDVRGVARESDSIEMSE